MVSFFIVLDEFGLGLGILERRVLVGDSEYVLRIS